MRTHGRNRSAVVGPLAWTALLVLAGCFTGTNYADPAGPRFAGPVPAPATALGWRDTLKGASFHVENSQEVDSALAVLTSEADLADVDVLLLQEMDEPGARRVAEALGMGFVYYPAIVRRASGRDFGNAVLSRWPIVSDEKLVLPHLAIFGRTQRIATVVTIQVGRTPIRVYSVHLATTVNMAWRDRSDQMRTVLEDAAPYPHVIVGGDLNSAGLGALALERGFSWPTRSGPRTTAIGRLDHIMFKGLVPPDSAASGTILDNRNASDHRPVWARGVVY